MIVLGAGMSGCLFGALNKDAIIYEAQEDIPDNHNAVLRFREDKISKATGIPFKKVKVRKAIWSDDCEINPSPRLSNLYSQKVTGKISDRSINNIDPVERYIAPSDFSMILADMCHGRIHFNHKVKKIETSLITFGIGNVVDFNDNIIDRNRTPIISTMPMRVLSKVTSISIEQDFNFKSINVSRYKIKDCDVYQTIYYPYPSLGIYRATLTGEDLIIESTLNYPEGSIGYEDELEIVLESFAINKDSVEAISKTEQKYGKISPIDDAARKNFMFNCTRDLAIYSLGRFACWRNILLDDVYDDIYKIKAMSQQDLYDVKRNL